MSFSGSLDQLAPALAAAQGELTDALKTSDNPHFKSKYADLAEVLQTARPVLSRHGLALIQGAGSVYEGKVAVTSMLLHKSGQWIQDTLTVPLAKNDAQGVVAGVTYGRRCGGAAIIGIAQDDDDGETVVGRGSGKGAAKTKAAPKPEAPVQSAEALSKAFKECDSPEALRTLAPEFAKLGPEDQATVLPTVKEARARLGL